MRMHRFLLWLSACCVYVAVCGQPGAVAARPPLCSAALRSGTSSAGAPGGASNVAPGEEHLLQDDCSWQMLDTADLFESTSSRAIVTGMQALLDGTAHPAGVIARQGSPPAVVCATGSSGTGASSAANAAFTAGGSLTLVNVLLADCQLPAPTAGAGIALRPRGLLPAAAGSSSGPALVLQDVRVVVDAATLQKHIAYFKQQQTPDVWTRLWLYTDDASFLHITWWSDGITTWRSVGLVLGDSLEAARATGQPPEAPPAQPAATPAAPAALPSSPAAAGSGAEVPEETAFGQRRLQQRAAAGGASSQPPGRLNYVLWADNATFVPQLLGRAGVNTSVPLLVYQTSNITLGAAQAGPKGVPIFRPFSWVGLSSANTSVDLEMSVNQLLLTGRWSNLTSDHLVVENLATGNEGSVKYADPVALDCTNCLWYLAFDRREFRHSFINSTMVVPAVAPDFNATLYWASLLNSQLPFFRTQAKFMREVYQMAALEVVVLEPGVSMLVLRGRSRTALMLNSIMSVAPVVAPALPLPEHTPVAAKASAEATGISPVVKSAATAKELEGVLSAPQEPLARSTLVLLVSNITLMPATEALDVTCTQTLIGPYGTQDEALAAQPSDTFLHLSYAQGLLQLPESLPPSATVGPGQEPLGDSGSADGPGQGGCLTLQHMTLQGLAQGPGADKAANLSDPSVWTLLLWGINRMWASSSPPLGIVTVAMLLPAPEFDVLQDLSDGNSAMVLPLSGGNDVVLTGATRLAAGRLFVSSLTGAGLQASNITLLRQPLETYTAASGAQHHWPHDGQSPFGHTRAVNDGGKSEDSSERGMSKGAIVAISTCAACTGLLLLGLAAWCCCRRRQPLPPPPADTKQGVPYLNGHSLPPDVDSSHWRDQGGSQQRAVIVADSLDESHSCRHDVEQPQGNVGNAAAVASSAAANHSSGSRAGSAPKRSNSGSLASTAARISSGAQRVYAAIASRSQQAHEARLRTAMVSLQNQSRGSQGDGLSSALSRTSSAASSTHRSSLSSRHADGVQLLGLLGRGAFAVVYKGVWRGRLVAVKVLHMTSSDAVQQLVASCGLSQGRGDSHEGRLRQMAVTEVAMGAALKHPNIVQVYTYSLTPMGSNGSHAGPGSSQGTGSPLSAATPGVGQILVSSGGQPSSSRSRGCDLGWELRLVMEYCDQGTLREALDRGTFASSSSSGGSSDTALLLPDLRTVLPLAVDVMSALVHLHTEGILHGDLKAANVLLSHATAPEADDDSSGMAGQPAAGTRRALRLVAKVADFGLSTALEAERTHISHVHGGTLTHMAPELLLTGRASQASDMYAAGILLWELVTGLRPWEGVGPALLPARVVQQGARPAWPPGCEQHLPARLKALTEAAWAQEPSARPDAAYMVQQLQQLQEELTWQHLFGMQGLAG